MLSEGVLGGICHCTLPPGKISKAVKHQTVEEIWYFLSGDGQIWRDRLGYEITELVPGMSVSICPDTRFQFKNTGNDNLEFIITTMPPWPGEDEAVDVEGYWE